MGINLPDISQIGRKAASTVATSINEIKANQQSLGARRVLRKRAVLAFSLTEKNGAFLKSMRILKRKKGEARWFHRLVPQRLAMNERKQISQILKVAFPAMNRRARRAAAFGRGWMLLTA